jgi:glucose-6-phosphate 1-dehydrogenase
MTTVQNVLGSRLANRVLEPIWNSSHIAEVEIVWNETLALEGRAGYYDGVGALKDMVQNHLLQVLCLVAMEPPLSLGERDLRDRKIDVLRSVRPLTDDDVVRRTCRARYLAGRIGDRDVPAYAEEEGVDPHRRTETFAEVELELESWRWSGTTRGDEAEESWRVLAPVMSAWSKGSVPLDEYPAGSDGPASVRSS